MTTNSADKPVIHDATPSWNGFNYQGKVGLYVSLSTIRDQLISSGELDTIYDHLKTYTLEYEWIEDFSIRRGNEYLSIHQVKHYNSSAFSSYTDAIETIILRKQGIFLGANLKPFICSSEEKTKDEMVQEIMAALTSSKILDANHKILGNWKDELPSLDPAYRDSVAAAITAFSKLHTKAYSKSIPVYVHTSSTVGEPNKELSNYAWSHQATKSLLTGVNCLGDLGVYVKGGASVPFQLALDDSDLENRIRDLIKEIQSALTPHIDALVTENSLDCYLAALLLEVDRHIAFRHLKHGKIKSKEDLLLSDDQLLHLSTLADILKKEVHLHDQEFFSLRSKMILERTLSSHLSDLDNSITECISEGIDSTELLRQRERIIQYRRDVISKLSPTELLIHLERSSPHEAKKAPHDIFYSTITQPSMLAHILVAFISALKHDIVNFFATCANNEKYSPSCIDASNSPLPAPLAHKEIARKILAACDSNAFVNALLYDFHYIAIKAKDNFPAPFLLEPPRFYAVPESGTTATKPVFYEKKGTQLIHLNIATKRLNGEIC